MSSTSLTQEADSCCSPRSFYHGISRYSYFLHYMRGNNPTECKAYESQSGSKDRGDPLVGCNCKILRRHWLTIVSQTSNIFVTNLPAHVTEPILGNFFAQHCGPVGSVSVSDNHITTTTSI